MISDEQRIAYPGALPDAEWLCFEEELAGDTDALRRLLDRERRHAALRTLRGSDGDRARGKIVANNGAQSTGGGARRRLPASNFAPSVERKQP